MKIGVGNVISWRCAFGNRVLWEIILGLTLASKLRKPYQFKMSFLGKFFLLADNALSNECNLDSNVVKVEVGSDWLFATVDEISLCATANNLQ